MVAEDKSPVDVDQVMAALRQRLSTRREISPKRGLATKVAEVFVRLVELIMPNQRS